MGIGGFIYVLILAVLLALFFNVGFNIRGPWGTIRTFFLILLLTIGVTYVWIRPFGPYWRDIYWLPPLIVGVMVALLLAAATPAPKPRIRSKELAKEAERSKNEENIKDEEATSLVAGLFFWIVIIALLTLILLGLFSSSGI